MEKSDTFGKKIKKSDTFNFFLSKSDIHPFSNDNAEMYQMITHSDVIDVKFLRS